jgi:hypothetical protein
MLPKLLLDSVISTSLVVHPEKKKNGKITVSIAFNIFFWAIIIISSMNKISLDLQNMQIP